MFAIRVCVCTYGGRGACPVSSSPTLHFALWDRNSHWTCSGQASWSASSQDLPVSILHISCGGQRTLSVFIIKLISGDRVSVSTKVELSHLSWWCPESLWYHPCWCTDMCCCAQCLYEYWETKLRPHTCTSSNEPSPQHLHKTFFCLFWKQGLTL